MVYKITGPNGSVREQIWAQNKPYLDVVPNNPFIKQQRITVYGTQSKTAVTNIAYDKNGNLLSRTEYDWISYNGSWGDSLVTSGLTTKRQTSMTYYYPAPDSSDTSNSTYGYWRTNDSAHWSQNDARRLDAVRRQEISDGSSTFAVSELDYDNAYKNGNVTEKKNWDSVKSSSVPGLGTLTSANSQALSWSFDAQGNLTDICPTCSNSPDDGQVKTHITYGNYPSSSSVAPYPTEVAYAYGSSIQRTFTYQWNYSLGTLSQKTDVNNSASTTYTYDQVGRRIEINEASTRKTKTKYDDSNNIVTVRRDLSSIDDGSLQSITRFDQLGRVKLVQTRDDTGIVNSSGDPTISETGGIKVKTIYKTFVGGHLVVTSTPTRNTDYSDPTTEWTCQVYDQSDRLGIVSVFKGATSPEAGGNDCEANSNQTARTEVAYDANRVRTTDPTGKIRDQYTDALGRLTQVIEDPGSGTHLNYQTDYNGYDPFDNLTSMAQGSQTRTFQYTSLNRLKQATNPESGTTTYTYWDNGLLRKRTDARTFAVEMFYDPLQRIMVKDYSGDGGVTPDVAYTYLTTGANQVGHLESVSSAAASITYSNYDALGRFAAQTEAIDGTTYTLNYTYLLNDELASIQYPSGTTINYTLDDVGRPTKAASSTTTFVDMTSTTGITNPYFADGRIRQMKLGNNLFETHDYHTPGTTTKLQLGTGTSGTQLYDKTELQYVYSATQNNGNLSSHGIVRSGSTWNQSFTYDGVNRLSTASETGGFNRTYGYDQYGNRWVSSTSGMTYADSHEPTVSTNFNTSTNRLAGQTYDSAGNLQSYDPRTLYYDAENRIYSITSASNGSGSFAYDGDGRRIKKVWTPNGGATTATLFIYDALGRVAAEYSSASSTGETSYPFPDVLGSVRTVTNASAAVVECFDYLPFGRILSSSDNGRSTAGCHPAAPDTALNSRLLEKFTSKQRDIEIGLDYFGARYYSAAHGRFTSADFVSGQPDNPQSWNKYAYSFNNPFRYVDPNGKWPTAIHELLITGAFGPRDISPGLSSLEIGWIQKGSAHVDYSLFGQTRPTYAYQHGMIGDETAEQATAATDKFINDNEAAAQHSSENGWTASALASFGRAMHPVMDRVSPSHAGERFEGVPSNVLNLLNPTGTGIVKEVLGIYSHSQKESQITKEQFKLIVDKLRTEYLKTFGPEAFEKATGCKKVEGCSIDYTAVPSKYWKK